MTERNPYSPPKSEVRDHAPAPEAGDLASRWARLGAALLDGLVSALTAAPLVFYTGYWQAAMAGTVSVGATFGVSAANFALFAMVNGYLLATAGQTIGKRLVGTRIVTVVEERPPTLGKVLGGALCVDVADEFDSIRR